MVHCRMSALGHVVGGAETVVRALLEVVGPGGTLVAYIGWEDRPPDHLEALSPDERELVLAEHPPYDPRIARARRDHGRVPEALRTWPGAAYSGHPEAGVAAVGPKADVIVQPHRLGDAYGASSPYARVVEHRGQVVLLGAPLETLTLVHHAEAIARVPGKRHVDWRCPVLVDGAQRWVTLRDIDTSLGAFDYRPLTGDVDYVEWFAQSALDAGAGRAGALGAGSGHVFEAEALVSHAAALMEEAFGTQT